jgi:D-alanyl-D-alanine carboxypeptidase
VRSRAGRRAVKLAAVRTHFASLGLVLALAACGSNSTAPTPQANSAFDARLLAAIEEFVAGAPAVPAAVMVVRAPRLGIHFEGAAASLRESASDFPLAARPFRIASVTKIYTAAAIFRLLEMDRIDLDAPIARYIDDETRALLTGDGYNPDLITITHLLGHASGLRDYADTTYEQAVMADPQRRWTRHQQVAFAMEHGDPLGAPGAAFHYSDTGYIILGLIIERVSSEPYAAATRKLVGFDRLGLDATWFESLETARSAAPPLRQFMGATAGDVATFLRALFRGEVFERPETLAAALAVPVMQDQTSGDAHNLIVFRQPFGRRTCYGHTGFWGVQAIYCPADDITVVLTVNNAAAKPQMNALTARVAAEIETTEAASR